MPKGKSGDRPEMKPVNAGAIDIGSRVQMAAVGPTHVDKPVRSFGTFTPDLHDLADWFKGYIRRTYTGLLERCRAGDNHLHLRCLLDSALSSSEVFKLKAAVRV